MKKIITFSIKNLLTFIILSMAMQARAESISVHFPELTTTRMGFPHCGAGNADKYPSHSLHINVGKSGQITKGDVDGDGEVNVTDISYIVNKILGFPNTIFDDDAADIDGDGEVNINDVMQVVEIILNGTTTEPSYLTCPDGQHPHIIDLGLPSGTKWACCNVGASKPEANGRYYAWGETEKKSNYDESTYIHGEGSWSFNDIGSDIAGTQYDVAHVKWGGSWVMPSYDQQMELYENCTCTWTTLNGVYGELFTGSNGGTIFLSAAGFRRKWGTYEVGSSGNYWSSSVALSYYPEHYACGLRFDSCYVGSQNYDRGYGYTVRPVNISSVVLTLSDNSMDLMVGKSATVKINSGRGNYGVSTSNASVATASLSGSTVTITGNSVGTANVIVKDTTTGERKIISVTVTDIPSYYLACPDSNHPHFIDLGLPSGTKWTCCNLGADKPEDSGDFYAWGETEGKIWYNYVWSTYTHCDGTEGTCHNLGDDIAGTQYDVAHVKWGVFWLMPTYDQQLELLDNCNNEWTSVKGVNGQKFTSKINGASIFLPAAGLMGRSEGGRLGCYWSSTQNLSVSYHAYILYFDSGGASAGDHGGYSERCEGLTVRPVSISTVDLLSLSLRNVEVPVGQSTTVEITSGSGSYEVSSSNASVATASLSGKIVTITGKSVGSAEVTVKDLTTGYKKQISATVHSCPNNHHPHMIDLGLPSGTKWACCNVGADKPEAYGGYYAWGETEVKTADISTYTDWDTYIHCDGTKETCHYLGSDIAGTQYDVAHVKWGGSWVMPSYDQQVELLGNCNLEWITVNGVNGQNFTSKINGASIFLPAAGVWGWASVGRNGYYWSSTQDPSSLAYAYLLSFASSGASCGPYHSRCYSQSVRPISR